METLREHFTYEQIDFNELPRTFEKLSETLELIHSKGAIVSPLNSDTTLYDSPEFTSLKRPIDFEKERKDNIVSLGKLMTGCYISKATGFKDFSNVDTEWFCANEEGISNCFQNDGLEREYFRPLFENDLNIKRGIAEEIAYYHVYLRRKRQAEQLSGMSRHQGIAKVLKNPNVPSVIPSDGNDYEEKYYDLAGKLHFAFNPLLIGISIAAIAIIVTMIILLS